MDRGPWTGVRDQGLTSCSEASHDSFTKRKQTKYEKGVIDGRRLVCLASQSICWKRLKKSPEVLKKKRSCLSDLLTFSFFLLSFSFSDRTMESGAPNSLLKVSSCLLPLQQAPANFKQVLSWFPSFTCLFLSSVLPSSSSFRASLTDRSFSVCVYICVCLLL